MFPECEYPTNPRPPLLKHPFPELEISLRVIEAEEGLSHIQMNHGELVLCRDEMDYPEAIRKVA